jgi:hypothetical protein
VTCLFTKKAWENAVAFPSHFVGVSFAKEIMRTGFVRPSASVAVCGVAGKGAHVSHMAKFMALPTLGENRRVTETDKLASFSKHPDAFLSCLFGNFTRMVHVCKNDCGVFPKVVGGTGIVRHLGDRDVSKNGVTSHLFNEDVRSGDVLLVVSGSDVT